MHRKNIAALILAAGSSTRMGSPKQLLPLNDTIILEEVIKNVKESNVDRIFCVIGANAKLIKPHIEKYEIDIIVNPNYKKGLSSSINCGINDIAKNEFDTVLITLADQPLIKPVYFNSLINTYCQNEEKIVATNYDGNFGVPVVIPQIYFSDLLQLKGDKGAKEFLNSPNLDIISLKTDSLFDIDTEEDYIKVLKQIKKA